jgi:hypothetical protein
MLTYKPLTNSAVQEELRQILKKRFGEKNKKITKNVIIKRNTKT